MNDLASPGMILRAIFEGFNSSSADRVLAPGFKLIEGFIPLRKKNSRQQDAAAV